MRKYVTPRRGVPYFLIYHSMSTGPLQKLLAIHLRELQCFYILLSKITLFMGKTFQNHVLSFFLALLTELSGTEPRLSVRRPIGKIATHPSFT